MIKKAQDKQIKKNQVNYNYYTFIIKLIESPYTSKKEDH